MTSISGSSSVNYAELYKQAAQEKFQKTDTDEDGKLSLGEFEAGASSKVSTESTSTSELFSSMDSDSDGYLTEDEMMSAMEAGPPGGGKGPPPGGMPPPGSMPTDGNTMTALFEAVSETEETEDDTSITSLFEVDDTDETEEEDSILSLLGASETDSTDETDSSEVTDINSLISEQIEQYRSASNAYQASNNLLSLLSEGGLQTA